MKRIIIALLLVVTGLVGLFLTSCGGMLLSYVMKNNGGGARSDRQFAGGMLLIGIAILGLTIWGIVKLIRSRTGGR